MILFFRGAFCAARGGGFSQLLLLPYFCSIFIEALQLVNCRQVFISLPAVFEWEWKSERVRPSSRVVLTLAKHTAGSICKSDVHVSHCRISWAQNKLSRSCRQLLQALPQTTHAQHDRFLPGLAKHEASIPPAAKNASVISSSRHFYYV